jgi:hypothetical protein
MRFVLRGLENCAMELPSHPLDPQAAPDTSTVPAPSGADRTQDVREPVNEPANDWELRALDVTAGEPD